MEGTPRTGLIPGALFRAAQQFQGASLQAARQLHLCLESSTELAFGRRLIRENGQIAELPRGRGR